MDSLFYFALTNDIEFKTEFDPEAKFGDCFKVSLRKKDYCFRRVFSVEEFNACLKSGCLVSAIMSILLYFVEAYDKAV